MSDADKLEIAREHGFVPEDEWNPERPPPKGGFKTAEEFLDDAPAMLLSMRKQNKKLVNTVSGLKQTLDQTITDSRAVTALVQQGFEREKREKEALKLQLEAQRKAAIDEGDSEAAIDADRKILALEAAPTNVPANGEIPPQQKARIQSWLRENDWYVRDPYLRDRCDELSAELEAEGVPLGQARLDAVAQKVRERYPDRVNSSAGLDIAAGHPNIGSKRPGPDNGKTFANLPQDARDAYERFHKLNSKLSKSQYLAEYEWEA
jgi:hypothetical protein